LLSRGRETGKTTTANAANAKCLVNVMTSFVLAECVKMTSISLLCGIVVILLYSPIAYACGKFLKTVLRKCIPNTVQKKIIMLLLIFITEKIQNMSMSFTRHPQPLAAPLNDDVTFECSLNIPADRFAWHHRPLGSNRWTLPSDSYNNVGKTSRLVVTFDNESKAGDYRCIAFFGELPRKLIFHILYSINNLFFVLFYLIILCFITIHNTSIKIVPFTIEYT